MHVLVTGGAGFIGSHLCEALVARGDSVVALDDLSTGSEENLASLRTSAGFDLVTGSVLDRQVVSTLTGSADAVVHLASPVGVRLVVAEPLRSLDTMIHGTESVLDAALVGHRKVLVASTSEVYGKNPGVLHEDADRVLGPTTVSRWTYSTSKAIDEFLAFGHWHQHGLPIVIARIFNTVGPRQSGAYGMVLPRLVAQALLGEELTVYGDGSQRRCFCNVADTVRALLGLLDEPGAIGQAFNVASPEEVTILDLAHRVLRLTGSASAVRFVPLREIYGDAFEDVGRRIPDIGRIRALLGWTPARSLDETIAEVVATAGAVGPANLLAPVA